MAAWCACHLPLAQAREVRVATFNVLNGTGAIGSVEYLALQAILARIDADVVSFQELQTTSFAAWSNLASVLGYPYAAISGNGPFSGSLYNGYFSRFPIRDTADVVSPPGAVELTRYPFRAVIDVPDALRPLVLWTMHHKSSATSIDKFRRAIEARRIAQDVDAYLAANPAHVEYVLTGDMNDDVRDSQTPAQFASQPSGAPSSYVLGADVSFPVAYATFPTDRYAGAGNGFVRVPAFWEGTANPVTRPASSRQLDYVFLSPALVNSPLGPPQAEVYHSDWDLGGGLPKWGAPLPGGTSVAASDHLAVFVDVHMADYSSVLPAAGFAAAGEIGGPFAPEAQTYAITETNSFGSTWSVETDAPWLSVAPDSLALEPFAPQEVDVFLNENAAALPPGAYSGHVYFRNETTDLLETRTASLTVRDPLAVWPAGGLAASGTIGGPFAPAEQIYVVTNKGTAAMAFTATATGNWLTVAPASWLLQAHDSVAVAVGINANANDLPIGTHVDAVVFSNQTTGLAEARPASLSIAGTLCDAVDRCDLVWTTGGDAPWRYQSTNTFDGADAAQSGVLATNQQTWLETVVTGPIQVGFRWQVSSRTNTHLLRFMDNGATRGQISGEVPWTLQTYEVAAGVHTLRWAYATTATAPLGANAGWVDRVTLDHLAVSPTAVWYASGEPGGPFAPASRTCVLTNSGSVPLNWSAAADAAWIVPADAGGELAPGASASVVFSIDANAAPPAPGIYPATLVFSNRTTGIALERAVVLSTLGALCEAVEACDFVWTTGGTTNWFRQTTNVADGSDAAQSGRVSTNQQTWIETTVTGPAVLRFQWRVSSRTNAHYLRFQVDGATQASISGLTPWMQRTQAIAAGTHVLRWVFTNNATAAANANAGWLDLVGLDTLTVAPSNAWHASGPAGGPFAPETRTYVLTNSGLHPLAWRAAATVAWIDVAPAAGDLPPGSSCEVEVAVNPAANLLPADLHAGAVVFSNLTAGGATERGAWLDARGSLCEAVDFCGLEWTAGGHAPWFFQTVHSTDGVDAARSGALTTNQQSWLETTVDGPVQIAFHWRASSLTNSHYLRFWVDGATQGLLSGETGWARRTYEVPPGRHVLRWTFTNNTSAAAGSNAAWLDQVSLDYLSALPLDVWTNVGPPGGPFAPGVRTYVLTNSGTETVSWSATPGANWIAVDPAAGEIEPGEGIVVEASITANADALGLGTRSAAVVFSNLTTGFSFQRSIVLTVQDSLLVTPASGSHAGFVGGPYSPATRTFVLSNSGPAALAWSVLVRTNGYAVTTRTNWVTPEPAAGMLDPGASQDVIVAFNEQTAGLSAATHYARLTFTNETSGLAQERYLYLTLQEPLAVSGAGWTASGPVGGPFAPTSAVFVLTNRSPISQSWTVSSDADWLALGSAGGTLASSSSVAVAARFNAQSLALPAGGHSAALVFSNQTQGSVLTQMVSLAVGVDFCDAVEACGLNWTFGGNAPWVYQSSVAHDGIDAAASGPLLDSQESWMQTTVAGPGTLSFWWKVSSEASYDYLEFWIDGVRTNRVSGEVNWQQQTFALGSGAHVLRWRYVKDEIVTAGGDRGWVDLVAWTAARTAMGVPVAWYQGFGLAPGAAETWDDLDWRPAASGDPNWFQYVAGLTPTNSADAFRILDIQQGGGQPTRLEWRGGTNGPTAPYVVQSAPALDPSAWESVGASPRAAGVNVWTNAPPAGGARYYRILAEPD